MLIPVPACSINTPQSYVSCGVRNVQCVYTGHKPNSWGEIFQSVKRNSDKKHGEASLKGIYWLTYITLRQKHKSRMRGQEVQRVNSALVCYHYITDARLLESYCGPTWKLLTSSCVSDTSLKGFFPPQWHLFFFLPWRNGAAKVRVPVPRKIQGHKYQAVLAFSSHFSSSFPLTVRNMHLMYVSLSKLTDTGSHRGGYKFTPDWKQLATTENRICIHTPTSAVNAAHTD